MPRETLVERFYCDFAGNPLGDVIGPRNGRIAVLQGPGLDVDPDPRLIEKLRKWPTRRMPRAAPDRP
jgi:L-alanine-DL-glutamate epimerase-like enolase superfamily enzyme